MYKGIMIMENWQRAFAYSTFIMVTGLAVVVFGEDFIRFVQYPGWQGYAAIFGYGVVYLNFSYLFAKRYTTKAPPRAENYSYVLALLMIIGPIVWTFIKDLELLPYGQMLFIGDLIAASLIGTYFGIKRGTVRRKIYLENLRESQRANELKRPHNHLNRN